MATKNTTRNTIATMEAGNKIIKIADNLLQFISDDPGLFSLFSKKIVNVAQRFDKLPERYSFTRYNSIPTIDNGIVKYVTYSNTETIHFDEDTIVGINSRCVPSETGTTKPTDSIVSHNVNQYIFDESRGIQVRIMKQYKDVEIEGQKCLKHFQTAHYSLNKDRTTIIKM